ncbi:hypothetical protein [Sphingomonas sp. S6]|jgi:hypothetical protein|uniref:hypothetical protein n=1 Tax=Sphingomonas sp. S6 TaxID=3368600 RepID=UPI000FA04BE4|nr:hypothetical protein [uncultured Sphingomonas sp.]RTL18712.1 MAG: hypothetical protein EKK50_07295 [Sphingomonadaceae bacterium]
MWNSTGTVTVTNGSPVITGAGTVFSFPNAQPGQAFVGPNGLPMEIASVDSASQITLARPYGGATAAGQPFTILPTQSFANDLALAFAGFKNVAGAMLDTIGQGMFPDGSVATPGIRFAADQDTGWRRAGSNSLSLVTGGVDRMTIDASGQALFPTGKGLGIAGLPAETFTMSDGQFGPRLTTEGSFRITNGNANVDRFRVDPSGNVGIGTAAPAIRLHVVSPDQAVARIRLQNSLASGTSAGGYDLVAGVNAERQESFSLFNVSTSQTALTVDGAGNLLVGSTAGAKHMISKPVDPAVSILEVARPTYSSVEIFGGDSAPASGVAAVMKVTTVAQSGRSISAGGTINASGADYAEYVRKAAGCSTIRKGDVCGVDWNGQLVTTWADAVRYVVKSTDPNLVGGDTWAAHLGQRPEAPVYAPPAYNGPAEPTEADAWNAHDAYNAAQADYAKAVAAAEAAHVAAVKDHAAALTAWEAELEAARQTVDRIAFCGQVPVNVDADTLAMCEAALGDGVAVYLVAVAHGDGIGATAVRETDMTLPLYMRRLGAVWAIRDGRPWVDVQHG